MKRNWRRRILGGLSLTSALFIFQACYGSMQDFGYDSPLSGNVKSKKTGAPIKGIKVSLDNNSQYEYTDASGDFFMFAEEAESYRLLFQDIDSAQNGRYSTKDTLIANASKNKFLNIELEEI